MSESNDKRPCMKLSALFITSPDSFSFDTSKSPRSVFDVKKSPRNFEGGVVGLGIVAAMNDSSETHDPLSPAISTRTAKSAFPPRSVPIPIVPGKTVEKFRGPIWEEGESELSETYTCVITHIGNESIKKHEYFERPGGDSCGNFGQPKHVKSEAVFPGSDFLNSCNKCSKKLHGLDIFMYRGDQAFCSAECRHHQILIDERRETRGCEACKSFDSRGYEACKSFDYSSSPCSDPRIFYTGVAAA